MTDWATLFERAAGYDIDRERILATADDLEGERETDEQEETDG
ncbi:hypothetical protein [Natronolimnobius sp. AArcel1]|nr:hypothetical protein [Natronolimnobius sp. AArcel1]